jgi:ADP-ribose pyrophosphatase YjhB (NUDIX family)/mannose-6-phosphate isomerase-like protein (cupin superfamily)
MEHVKKQQAIQHTPSSSCIVYEYPMQNSKMNIAIADIAGRYPEQGYAVNHQCSEMGYVFKGSGKLVTESGEAILSLGDVVYIAPGEKFYWEGHMSLVLPASPAWQPAQHEIVKGEPSMIRKGVYGIALNESKVLLVKQEKGPHAGKWELPGGKIEEGETLEEALRREFCEEVGLSFEKMRFFKTLTAITDAIDQQGKPYQLHQIGHIYFVEGLSHLKDAEMEHAWISLQVLASESTSPFVQQAF